MEDMDDMQDGRVPTSCSDAPDAPIQCDDTILDAFLQAGADDQDGVPANTGANEQSAGAQACEPIADAPRHRAPAFSIQLPHGVIKFYGANLSMEAICSCPGHRARCVKTRTTVAGRRAGQGRPLGYLLAWLDMGPTCADGNAHSDVKSIDVTERRAARRKYNAEVRDLAAFEREQSGDESEPERFV